MIKPIPEFDRQEVLKEFLRHLLLDGFREDWVGEKAGDLLDALTDIEKGK